MNKLTLTLTAALIACVLIVGASPFAEAAGGRGGGGGFHGGGGHGGGFHGGVGRGFRGTVIKGQGLAVPGGVKNLGGPVKGQALSVPGGVLNLGPGDRGLNDGLALGFGGVGGGYGGFGGFGYGYGFAPFLYESGHIPVPPYFALHPPVYYSHPVPRTYGYSPFAYRHDVRTPEIVEAAVIENPYVTGGPDEEEKEEAPDKADASDDDTAAQATPLEILNPYVDATRDRDDIQVSKTVTQVTSADSNEGDEEILTEVSGQEILNPYVDATSDSNET